MDTTKPAESKLERVIRKIKRCLALARSANENEAATAMRQAQALMRQHRLSEDDVRASDVGEAQSGMTRVTRRPYWDRQLSAVVARVFGCTSLSRTIWNPRIARRVESAVFVGVTPSQHIALYAYEALLLQVKQARKEYAAGVRAGRYKSSYSPDTAANHFALAWVGQMGGKLRALVPTGEVDLELEQHSTGRNLVTVQAQDQALIDLYLADMQLGKARKPTEHELDLNAQIAGMLAGAKVELHAGLATGDEEQALLASA